MCDSDHHATTVQWNRRNRSHQHDNDDDDHDDNPLDYHHHDGPADHDHGPANDDDHYDRSHHGPAECADSDDAYNNDDDRSLDDDHHDRTVDHNHNDDADAGHGAIIDNDDDTACGGGRRWSAAGLHRLVCTCHHYLTSPQEPVWAQETAASGSAGPLPLSLGRQKPVAAMMEPLR